MPSQLDALTEININDLTSSFSLEKKPVLAATLRRLFINPARKFAQQIVDFDEDTGQTNLAEASRKIMRKYYVHDVCVHGHENVPANGSMLFLSNHPGMTDTLSLFAAINRPDLKVIALHRPFLVSLGHVTKQLFFIDGDSAKRMNVVRQVSAHLRNGGAALTFPAGKIEPDPTVYQGASTSLNDWTDSAGVFMRFVPQTKIVPVLVSGVVWKKTARHWLTYLKRAREEREKLATALQLLAMVTQNIRPTTVHVQFAKPITTDEINSKRAEDIHQAVILRMRNLIENPTQDQGISVLYPEAANRAEISNNPSAESI